MIKIHRKKNKKPGYEKNDTDETGDNDPEVMGIEY